MELNKEQVKALIRTAIADYHQAIYSELEHVPIERKGKLYQYHRDRILRDITLNMRSFTD